MIFGALAALVEKKIRKFFAYSSINQMGFLLIGLVGGTPSTVQTSIIYLIIYIIMNIILFIIVLNVFEEKTFRPLIYLTDLTFYTKNSLIKALPLIVILFSMAGIPPLAGFFGKYYLFLMAFEKQFYFLVIVGMFTSMISTFYYLKIIKFLIFDVTKNVNINFKAYWCEKSQYILNFCIGSLILKIFLSPLYFEYLDLILIKK
jgi:NADH-quinone oxidoreductase subunit N